MNPISRLHESQGTPEPPKNPGQFSRCLQLILTLANIRVNGLLGERAAVDALV